MSAARIRGKKLFVALPPDVHGHYLLKTRSQLQSVPLCSISSLIHTNPYRFARAFTAPRQPSLSANMPINSFLIVSRNGVLFLRTMDICQQKRFLEFLTITQRFWVEKRRLPHSEFRPELSGTTCVDPSVVSLGQMST